MHAKLQQRTNNGWPFLADFELSVATHIAKRAFEVYSITGANQCGRGLAEKSLDCTGVYLPVDDPHGTPQFCWTGSPAGELLECSTFNDLRLEAVAAVGRADLWGERRQHARLCKRI